jgi:hypothetical protein
MTDKCIDPDRVPCDKARKYLKKRGLLCDVLKPSHPEPKKRGWFQEWFG